MSSLYLQTLLWLSQAYVCLTAFSPKGSDITYYKWSRHETDIEPEQTKLLKHKCPNLCPERSLDETDSLFENTNS